MGQGSPSPTSATLSLEEAQGKVKALRARMEGAIFGQSELITEALAALFAGGHILITGAPGLAKTTLVRALARELSGSFGRVQFTPDLLPSDIVGSEVLNVDTGSGRRHFEFAPGPVFVNLLLADEINRASPRTQSALLEAMQERQVTMAGKAHPLPRPFMVFATQNPFESEGTFPLPEAQMDRFLIHSLVDYPGVDAERRMLGEHAAGKLFGEDHTQKAKVRSEEAVTVADLDAVAARVAQVQMPPELLDVTLELVRTTRPLNAEAPEEVQSGLWYGAGPRAGLSLVSTARALALMDGSEVVLWRHVRRLARPVLRHRIRLNAQARRDGLTEDSVVDLVVKRLEAKHGNLSRDA